MQLALVGPLATSLLMGPWISPAAAQNNNPSTGVVGQSAGNNTTSGGVRFQPAFGRSSDAGNSTTSGRVPAQPSLESVGATGAGSGTTR